MPVYFSTFISGFQDAVNYLVKDMIKDITVIKLLDGLILYETNINLDAIKAIKIFNNTFLLMNKYIPIGSNPVEFALKQFMSIKKRNDNAMTILEIVKPKTFRIVTSEKNKLTSINKDLRNRVETKISKDYPLQSDRLNPDIEFWVVARSEGIVLIGLRITRNRSNDKFLLKGELRPELSGLLCWLSEPSEKDVFLDPFCGYGSIPIERSVLSGYKEIIAADIDSKKLLILNKKIEDIGNRNNFSLRNVDFFTNIKLKESSIDKIVTDPPWGDFEELQEEPKNFYSRFITRSLFYLKTNGILVFITSRKSETEFILEELESKITLMLKLDILISGKKAGVYKVVKKY